MLRIRTLPVPSLAGSADENSRRHLPDIAKRVNALVMGGSALDSMVLMRLATFSVCFGRLINAGNMRNNWCLEVVVISAGDNGTDGGSLEGVGTDADANGDITVGRI